MTEKWCRFCPGLNFAQYLSALSEERGAELDKRAFRLLKRAVMNHLYKASEFSWEISAWTDVFGPISDDDGLRMDKRPYEFTQKDANGDLSVKTKIPDATMGLRPYDNYSFQREYTCIIPGCEEDHSSKQPDKRLSKKLLSDMMENPDCGLVVDGVWGETNLIFPSAVYEAKKRARSYAAAEEQIYHACRTYMAMLDDLARDPDNFDEYQLEETSRYQFFAFTSCGSCWKVFAAWNLLNDCLVETIWEGDVLRPDSALELICLVDQIHEYATQHHRPFVMKHLEAWHDRHKRTTRFAASLSPRDAAEDLDPTDDQDASSSIDYSDPNEIERLLSSFTDISEPEWSRLKEETKMTISEKAQRTRAHNLKLRSLAHREPKLDEKGKQTRKRKRSAEAATDNQQSSKKRQRVKSQRRASGGAMVKQTQSNSSRVTRSMKKNKLM